jgi:hypothetical protein
MRVLLLGSVALALLACNRETERQLKNAPAASALQTSTVLAARDGEDLIESSYPPGRWRLASDNAVYFSLLRLSHILIRYEGVPEGIVSFELPDWQPSPPAPARTLEQARSLAQDLAERLQRKPEEFEALARELSEDVATKALGGVLGTRSASDYLRAPEVLDAVAALRAGDVSRVVETQYGFHILKRLSIPEERMLAGARILISHDKAPWLGMFLSRGPLPNRSFEDALTLAQSLYERAKAGEPFAALAREYSNHREAVRGGDFGAWSTHEATPFPRELEVLASLDVGEIHPPMDTPFGVAIIQRLPERPRKTLAMTTVELPFEPLSPDSDGRSRPWVMKNIRSLADELVKDGSQFAALQQRYCCARETQWVEGRGEAEAEVMLAGLRTGEVATEPVQLAAALGIVKRVDAKPQTPERYTLELPAPEKPDLLALAESGRLQSLVRGFAAECAQALALEPATTHQLTALFDGFLNKELAESADRSAPVEQLKKSVEALLGPERFRRYQELFIAHLEAKLLEKKPSLRRRTLTGAPVSAAAPLL